MIDDETTILAIVDRFFGAFASGPGLDERMAELRSLFLPGAVVVRTCGDLAVYDVDGFVEPRHELLADGSFEDFAEWPVAGTVTVYGDVAHWWGDYAKGGRRDGAPFEGRGVKSIQLVRTDAGWRISAAAWDDERPHP
ncbi:nuclear transport factor 2 family protein [Nocardioides mangrovicus]|uniref:Nuclear transport factor 2 family protein n=1 Tax=Nocardioides mangrovicus TaxID=2478913 RepID=A0A3L8P7Q5_9ACTN|nr:DUF4440 domain-containing protein [Nocardioides mangrovicus]RLV50408.1 nuclear transport factor 2 family protein [Nocardioides mangrovicus]